MDTQSLDRKLQSVSSLFVRLALGTIFVVYGAGKLWGVGPKATGPGIAGFTEVLAGLGVPFPEAFAWFVALLELVGGLLLLVGLLTRYVSVMLAADMLVAIWLVHLPNGFEVANGGYEFALTLMLVSVALALSGPGRLSLEYAVFDRELLPRTRSEPPVDPRIDA